MKDARRDAPPIDTSRWYVVAIAGVVVFATVAMAVAAGSGLTTFDQTLAHGLQKNVSERGIAVFRNVTLLGTGWALGIASAVVAAVLLLRRHFVLGIGWIVAQAGAVLLVKVVKAFLQRDRPGLGDISFYAHGWSFPSGHVVRTGAFCGTAVYLVYCLSGSRRATVVAGVIAAAWSLVMAFSRVYLGAHFPSDVVAGLVLAVAWVALCITQIERQRPPAP